MKSQEKGAVTSIEPTAELRAGQPEGAEALANTEDLIREDRDR
jgi:hypothetical protein